MSPEESRMIWEEMAARQPATPRRALRWWHRAGRALARAWARAAREGGWTT